jgi:hypothetical protein
MPRSHVYIGEFRKNSKESLKPGEFWAEHMPRAITRALPPVQRQFFGGLGVLMKKISSGELYGKQIDWGCWVAIVTPRDIMGFVDELYGEEWVRSQSSGFNNFGKRLDEVVAVVENLDPREKYALIGYEFY